jgi:hypothetical protein
MEVKSHLDSLKKGWADWGLQKKRKTEDTLQVQERVIYGSHYERLGAQSRPLLANLNKSSLNNELLELHNKSMHSKQTQIAKLKMRLLGLNGKTTQDFINEATSSEGGGNGPYEDALSRLQQFN